MVSVFVCKRMFEYETANVSSDQTKRIERKRFLWASNIQNIVSALSIQCSCSIRYTRICVSFFLPFGFVVSLLFTDGIENEHRTIRPRGTWYTQDHTMQTRFQRLLGECLLLLLCLLSLSLVRSCTYASIPTLLSLPQHIYLNTHIPCDRRLFDRKSNPKTCWTQAQAQVSAYSIVVHTIVHATASLY